MSKNVLHIVIVGSYICVLINYLISLQSKTEIIEMIEYNYTVKPPWILQKILKDLEVIRESQPTGILFHSYQREKLPTDLIFILKWTDIGTLVSKTAFSKNGQKPFIDNGCEYYNCFLTKDKSFLVDPTYFDAIVFDSENNWVTQPRLRSVRQKYIFSASDAIEETPICDPFFDSYYNLTWTYRLDSDLGWSYITILDLDDKVVGPKIDMKWIEPMKPTPKSVINALAKKKKAVAWFVDHCNGKSKREDVVQEIDYELKKYNLDVDTFGNCGKRKCPREKFSSCLKMLEESYYFYLSFEDYISDDYVTEKLLYAVQHYAVPIVYGGANYSRFLPPDSYIDAKKLSPSTIAYLINESMQNSRMYYSYFNWHSHYKYKKPKEPTDVCELCKFLNDPTKSTTIANNFRKWWYKDFDRICLATHNDTFVMGINVSFD